MAGKPPARVDFLQAGTRMGQSWVARHDVTRYNLGRLCIEGQDHYPDIEIWTAMLVKRGLVPILYSHHERQNKTGMIGQLWLYYRRPGGEARASTGGA
jgi:hypothetical protein